MSLENCESNPDSSTDAPMITEPANKTDVAPVTTEVKTEITALDKYWKAVKDNPSDFTGWTYLLQYVEQECKLEAARPAFDGFLARYPYCYGYWKKYADVEKKNNNMEEAEQVLERGLAAIPLSIDLWMYFISFSQDKYKNDDNKEEKIRHIFERALTAAGTDFRSDKLWEMQINWEEENKNLQNVTKLYDRLIAIPTQLYSHNYECLCSFVNKNHPRDILSLDEFLKLREDVVKKKSDEVTEEIGAAPDIDIQPEESPDEENSSLPVEDAKKDGSQEDAMKDGSQEDAKKDGSQEDAKKDGSQEDAKKDGSQNEDASVEDAPVISSPKDDSTGIDTAPKDVIAEENSPQNGHPVEGASTEDPTAIEDLPPGAEEPPGTKGASLEDENEIAAIKEKVIEIRKAIYKRTEQEVSRRWAFEEGVRRPYFHVKALEKVQLKNWRDYLDMEMENGTHERTVVLFERCLIACALYEEFWLKYANYLEKHSADAVRNVYKRACTVFLKKKPSIHLAWAAFEEKQDNFDMAEEVLQNFEKDVPKLAMMHLRRLSLARRQGHFDHVDELYNMYIEETDSVKEKTFYSIKRARYQAKVLHNLEAARETLETALSKDKSNAKLYLQMLDLEYQQADIDEAHVNLVFDKALDSPLELEHRVAFSQRRLEFMEDFSSSISRIQESYEVHQKLVKELNVQAGKKRKSQETSTETSQPEKKPRVETKFQNNGSSDYYNSQSYYSQPHSQHNYDGSNMQQAPPAHGYYGQPWNTGYNTVPYGYDHNQWAPYSNQYYSS